uniref:Putative nymphal anticomplement protein n=1 Tax=Ixodes ricinus TaxID=34613 RepID=A0A090X8S1_IXORI
MEVALICLLLGTAFVGMQFSPCALVVAYDRSLYEKVLGRNPGICGAWYRNPNKTEAVMKCVLGKVPQPVKDKWEDYMDTKLPKPEANSLAKCATFTTIMPGSFINYETEENDE